MKKNEENEIIKIALQTFNNETQIWGNSVFTKEWMDEFRLDIDKLKEEMLESSFLPDKKTMIMLRILFILQESQNNFIYSSRISELF